MPIEFGIDILKWTVKSTVRWWHTTHLIWAAYSAPLIKSMRCGCFHSRYHVNRMYSVDKLTASMHGTVEPSNATPKTTKDMLNVLWEKKKLTRYLCSHSQTTSAISVASRFRQLWFSYQNQLQTLRRPALLSRTSNSIGVVAQQTVAHVLICGVETAEYVWSIVFGVFAMRECYSALESTDCIFKGNIVSMHMRTVPW